MQMTYGRIQRINSCVASTCIDSILIAGVWFFFPMSYAVSDYYDVYKLDYYIIMFVIVLCVLTVRLEYYVVPSHI